MIDIPKARQSLQGRIIPQDVSDLANAALDELEAARERIADLEAHNRLLAAYYDPLRKSFRTREVVEKFIIPDPGDAAILRSLRETAECMPVIVLVDRYLAAIEGKPCH